MNAKRLPPEALDTWLAAAARELDIDGAEVPIGQILDVAAEVAHGVARPAAPLSTFLLGLALGRVQGTAEERSATLDRLSRRLTERARRWESPSDEMPSDQTTGEG